MSEPGFWDNQNAAQKVVDETGSIRRRVEPLNEAAKRIDDLKVMIAGSARKVTSVVGRFCRDSSRTAAVPKKAVFIEMVS